MFTHTPLTNDTVHMSSAVTATAPRHHTPKSHHDAMYNYTKKYDIHILCLFYVYIYLRVYISR